ncbi:2-furoyl-CoA dehydrogenase FAD binding subunit [Bosea sp. BE125]|uniref:FAD binding domain-containing protein n=1 Tax=Bosea sp. BE125 TaxID=2817909 RepID=UPI0028653E90|nr:FAD binding domain-containing protein [Bosea sp. BE125]MDR6869572.1 2-furoyl-CoA dehydrogenase FAD binding subunit [Bosea sp. BE125]
MKPSAFDYIRAGDLSEALDALARHGSDARIIAGGQSLLPMLNMRLAKPAVLIDVMGIPGLDKVRREGDAIVVPAGVRQAALMRRPDLSTKQPLLAAALPWLGHYQTRARGTVCGSAAHADPSAEIPLCLVALDGEIRLRSRKASRTVKAGDFFAGMMVTDKGDDELIEAVVFPAARPGTGHAFKEVARRHGDFAIVGCAAVVTADAIHLAVAGVADKPERRSFPLLDGSALSDALNAFAWDLDARDDFHATARLRRDLVRSLGRETIAEALSCRA